MNYALTRKEKLVTREELYKQVYPIENHKGASMFIADADTTVFIRG